MLKYETDRFVTSYTNMTRRYRRARARLNNVLLFYCDISEYYWDISEYYWYHQIKDYDWDKDSNSHLIHFMIEQESHSFFDLLIITSPSWDF